MPSPESYLQCALTPSPGRPASQTHQSRDLSPAKKSEPICLLRASPEPMEDLCDYRLVPCDVHPASPSGSSLPQISLHRRKADRGLPSKKSKGPLPLAPARVSPTFRTPQSLHLCRPGDSPPLQLATPRTSPVSQKSGGGGPFLP